MPLLLDTQDFGRWHSAVSAVLGHHRSELLSGKEPFSARLSLEQLGGYQVLHLQGRGRLRLQREQRQGPVLWLPLRGMMQESINGESWLAEPGTGLLFQPGDAMDGETSQELEGLSIQIPETLHLERPSGCPPLLEERPLQQRILTSAQQLAAAAVAQPMGAEHAADQLSDALQAWATWQSQPLKRESLPSRRRRALVRAAREWMAPRLQERFGVNEMSRALAISPRHLQYSFLHELGRSPMAEAKRLRLQRLRSLLLDPAQDNRKISALMTASGLIASGVTSADYRAWCGESPRQTRLHHR